MAMDTSKNDRVNKMAEAMKPSKPPAGKFHSMHIEAANNGYSVRTEREMPPKAKEDEGKGDTPMPSSSYGNKPDVFTSEDDVVAHVKKHIGK